MILKGALAGLVAITAPCAFVSVGSSLIIGLIARRLDVGEYGISAYPDFHAAGAYGSPAAAGVATRAGVVGAPVAERGM